MKSERTFATPMWILAVLALGFVFREAAPIVLWIVTSFFLFALLDPWMQSLNRRGITPVLSAIGLISLVTVAIAGLASMAEHFSGDLTEQFETYRKALVHLIDTASGSFFRVIHKLSPGKAAPAPLVGSDFGATLIHGVGSAISVLVYAVLCPILTFFMIAERKTLAKAFRRSFRQPSTGTEVWSKITQATGAFFLGNLVLGAVTFPIFCLVFYYFGVANPYALAGAASVLNLMPFLGAALASALPALDLLSQQASPTLVLGLVASCFVIHLTIANFVTPKILGSKLDLNATTSTIALIAWGELWGGLGLVLAIPITASLKIIFQHSENSQLHWIALLMSDDPDSLLHQTNRQLFPHPGTVRRVGTALGIKAPAAAKPPEETLPQRPSSSLPELPGGPPGTS